MRRFSIAAALGLLASCYVAEFAEDADGVFTCESTDDCTAEFSCVRGLCISDLGPVVEIIGPEENTVFDAAASVVFPLTVTGSGLTLDEPNGAHEPERGYLVVAIDGVELPTRLLSGNLNGSVTEFLDLGVLKPGYHRLRVKAMGLDNEPYDNPSAAADAGIWVNDGEPHVAVRHPWPGDQYAAGEPLDVMVGCLNCTFLDPTLASGDRVDEPVPEGHTHVYFDRREGVAETLDYPACLPACNFDYAMNGSLKPTGEAGVSWVQGVVLQVPTKPGTLTVTASLNYTGHNPYPAPSLDPADWDATPEIRSQLVNNSVTIFLVE